MKQVAFPDNTCHNRDYPERYTNGGTPLLTIYCNGEIKDIHTACKYSFELVNTNTDKKPLASGVKL